MLQRIRDLPDQGLYGVIGVLAVAALYVIGFVIKNSKNVSVDFVLFSAGVPLITLMVVMLLFGALLGVGLTLILARRKTPTANASGGRAQSSTPPPAESPVTPPPPPPSASIWRDSQPQVEGEIQPAARRATAPARRASTSAALPVLTARSRSTPSPSP